MIEWCDHHKDDIPQPEEADMKSGEKSCDLGAWDVEFFKVSPGVLYGIINAAYHLDIKGLVDDSCKTVRVLNEPLLYISAE